jgi:hypothetical protein
MGDFFARRHSGTFGRLATYLGWDDPNRPFNRILYRVIVIFVGIFVLIMAFHAFFGPIYIGSAAA